MGPAVPGDGGDVAAVLDGRARALAQPRDVATPEGGSFLLARVGGADVAVPLARARRVVPMPPISRVPGSGPAVVGISTVLGTLVPVADLAHLLRLPAAEPAPEGRLLVIDDRGSMLGLRTDDVPAVARLDRVGPGGEPAPGATASGLVAGVAPGGVLVLDVDALIADPRLWPTDRGTAAASTDTQGEDHR